MNAYRPAVAALAAVIGVGSWALAVSGQQVPLPAQPPLPLEPLGQSNEAIYAAFEGYGPLKNGENVLLIGYYNRNKDMPIEIPVGPNNRIEPGGPDQGQPTMFEPGRHYGHFTIAVPKGQESRKVTWTLTAYGQTTAVTMWANPPYWIDFYKNTANGNEPPVIKFTEDGPTQTGPPPPALVPPRGVSATLSGTVWQPVELKFWAADQPATIKTEEGGGAAARGAARGRGADADAARGRGDARGRGVDATVAIINGQVIRGGIGAGGGGGGGRGNQPPADIRVFWHKHRGPGDVTYDTDEIRLLNKGDGKLFLEAKTNAYFSAPGEYILRARVNDQSGDGGGGDQCCWTSAFVRVNIK
jgi:hypothetical protein